MYKFWQRWKKAILFVSLSFLSLFGGYFIYKATEVHGMGIRTDSVAYIWAARTLASGNGLGRPDGLGNFKPLTHWPPLYPILLAGFEWIGVDAITGARFLGILSYVLLIFLIGWMLERTTRSVWAAVSGALLCAISPTLIETSVMAMTEPLYIVISLASLLFLSIFLEKKKMPWLISAGFLAGLAFLTRYVGLALILSGGMVLLSRNSSWRQKIRDVFSFGVVSILPMSLWIIRNMLVAGSSTNRHFAFIPIPKEDFTLLLQTLDGWVKPAASIFAIGSGKIIMGVCVFGLVLFFLRINQNQDAAPKSNSMILLNGGYGICYAGMLFLSRFYFDPAITVWEPRMLAPLYLVLMIFLFWGLEKLFFLTEKIHPVVAGALAVVAVWGVYTFCALYLNETGRIVKRFHDHGASLAEVALRESPFIQSVINLPDAVVFTTNVETFYYFTGRNSFGYQAPLGEDWNAMVLNMMKTSPVLMVNFYRDKDFESELLSAIPGLETIYEDGVGIIYSSP
jgi:4-amino-4-deoxy-L-arabinose transferase-like glycosyltransferase